MDFLYGTLAGVSGILPFVHTNLVLGVIQEAAPAFAVALAFSHLAFELFPMILFGVPTADHAASTLPAQQMVQKGEGMQALYLGAAGLSSGALFALLLAPVFILIWPALYSIVRS